MTYLLLLCRWKSSVLHFSSGSWDSLTHLRLLKESYFLETLKQLPPTGSGPMLCLRLTVPNRWSFWRIWCGAFELSLTFVPVIPSPGYALVQCNRSISASLKINSGKFSCSLRGQHRCVDGWKTAWNVAHEDVMGSGTASTMVQFLIRPAEGAGNRKR